MTQKKPVEQKGQKPSKPQAALKQPKAAGQPATRNSTPDKAATSKSPSATAPSEEQLKAFEKGVTFMQSGNFAKAKGLFESALKGPAAEVANAAELRLRMCEKRLTAEAPHCVTAEDHYNYAVTLINQRRLEQAESHLKHALITSPKGDHLYYALALCKGLRGDLQGAYDNLRHAIELQPANRMTLRNDPDFAEIVQFPPIRSLVAK